MKRGQHAPYKPLWPQYFTRKVFSMSLMSSASSSKPSSFCVQKKKEKNGMMRGRGGAGGAERAPSSQGSPVPPLSQPAPSHTPSHCRAMPRGRGELWAAAGLRVASALRAAATVAPRGSRGLFRPLLPTAASPPSLPPCCARALRTSPSPPSSTPAGVASSGCLTRTRISVALACCCARACARGSRRQQAARASARVCAAGLRL